MKIKEPEFDGKQHMIRCVNMWEQGGIMNTKDEWAHRSYGRVFCTTSSQLLSNLYGKYLLETYLNVIDRAVSTVNIFKLVLCIATVFTAISLNFGYGLTQLIYIPTAIVLVAVYGYSNSIIGRIEGDVKHRRRNLDNVNMLLHRDSGYVSGRLMTNRKAVASLLEDEIKNGIHSGTGGILTNRALKEIGWGLTCPELRESKIQYLDSEDWIEQHAIEALNNLAEECGESEPLYPTLTMYIYEGNKIAAEREEGLRETAGVAELRRYFEPRWHTFRGLDIGENNIGENT